MRYFDLTVVNFIWGSYSACFSKEPVTRKQLVVLGRTCFKKACIGRKQLVVERNGLQLGLGISNKTGYISPCRFQCHFGFYQ